MLRNLLTAIGVSICAWLLNMISMLTVMGTSSGLGPPSEACQTPTTSYPTPAVRYPYTAMRQGDINGDGGGDSVLCYQGYATRITTLHNLCRGVINGRDIRVRLGTSDPAGSTIQLYAEDPYIYPHPLSRAETIRPHLNQWEFAIADINGDGIEDYIQSHSGAQGDRLYHAFGTPIGLESLVSTIDDRVSALPDGG
jgi:hypothetical protein